MGIMSLIGWLFGADAAAPSDAMKLDGTSEATLARALSALSLDERGWITFAEARSLFSTKSAQYAFGETDEDRLVRGAVRGRLQLRAGRGAGLFRAYCLRTAPHDRQFPAAPLCNPIARPADCRGASTIQRGDDWRQRRIAGGFKGCAPPASLSLPSPLFWEAGISQAIVIAG
jgi:hypothetical protein